MARWSERTMEQRKQEKQAAQIEERLQLFRLYRKNGWKVSVRCMPLVNVADDTPMGLSGYFLLKPPSGYAVIVRSLDELRRKAEGLK